MDPEVRLLHDIYAAALDASPWQGVVGQAADLLQATSAFLFTPFQPPAAGGFKVCHKMPESVMDRYLSEVADVDVWYHALLQRHTHLATGTSYRTRDLMPDAQTRRSRMHADYLAPCDIGHCLGAIVNDGSTGDIPVTPLSVYRPYGSPDFSAGDEACLRRIQPHLSQALLVRSRLAAATDNWGSVAIERVATAVVVLSRERRVLLANPAAEALFASTAPPLVRQGHLVADDAAQAAALAKALAACSNYRFDARFTLSIRLSGAPGNGVVIRLAPPPARTPKADQAAAVGFLVREGRAAVDPRAMLSALYQLTPAETALVMALFEGATPESYGAQRQVAQSTLKTQMRAVYDKTGVHKQSGLMRLVMSLAH
ncbi:MAG: hypothetical protein KIT47_06635 [Rhodoferax sp.]|nr:hypothetical protein [Rhodoferax sp.]